MSYDLYVVTDDALSLGRGHVAVAEGAYRGGADAVQLRAKGMGHDELVALARRIVPIARRYGGLFFVDDDVAAAVESGADGVHVGQSDEPAAAVRRSVPEGFLVGVSVGSAEEAVRAERDGADYVALSPVFDTRSKSDAGAGRGLAVLSEIRRAVSVPVIAIGGIDAGNAGDVVAAGADGVAVVSAVVSQPDVAAAARELRAAVEASKARR